MTEYLQQLLEREREAIVERDEVGARKNAVDEEIERLSQPGGAEDQRLNALAERFGGVLLSEIYDDVSLEDAPYFSALYGPSRHAIVVPDLSLITDQLDRAGRIARKTSISSKGIRSRLMTAYSASMSWKKRWW